MFGRRKKIDISSPVALMRVWLDSWQMQLFILSRITCWKMKCKRSKSELVVRWLRRLNRNLWFFTFFEVTVVAISTYYWSGYLLFNEHFPKFHMAIIYGEETIETKLLTYRDCFCFYSRILTSWIYFWLNVIPQ